MICNRCLPVTLVMLLLTMSELFAQHVPSKERVDPTLRRRTEIDGNNVRTSVFNFVFSGRTGAGQGVPYEWPKNTNRHYIALVALFAGAEVTDDTGGTVTIVDLPSYRQDPSGKDWNLNPIPGYFNPSQNKIAKSDEPETWPEAWPDKLNDPQDPGWRGKWNGFFGKNQFNADQEIYYRVGDDNYNRYQYTPDTTDPSRKGLGLIVDVRALEWSQASVADAVFFVQEIKNDGTKDFKKTGVTLWLADFVGGDGDSQDDAPDFDLLLDVAYSLDSDGRSSNPFFQGSFVGAAATLYLETPGNAVDNIDNDGDSPDSLSGPKVSPQIIVGERSGDQLDNNGNGLIDEDSTHIPFGLQRGVTFADRIANGTPGEPGSPVVTEEMLSGETANNAIDDNFNGAKDEDALDVGKAFKDGIDNNGNGESGSPVVTEEKVASAVLNGGRLVISPDITLYNVGTSDVGRRHADGIDNDGNGLVDEGIDEDIDVMIDESRNDAVDNDGDWAPLTDDVGLDGAPNTNDRGEGDGKPTSGVGTPFPGEPNIDKTDVAEADQIGLTNVQYLPAGAVDFSRTSDAFFWGNFMIPGSFILPGSIPTGEYDLFVSSGLFPLKAGQIERISYAVVFGNAVRAGNANVSGSKDDALRKRSFAQLAYNEDYQFAQAPIEPKVRAVPAARLVNGRYMPQVTLYWDDGAESSIDRFLAGIPGAEEKDFEGYKIYRATDPAFEDARLVTDNRGNPAPFLLPIASFDLKNGIKGDHPVDVNGVKFDLGFDNGISHSWTDTTVRFGQKYYYAVRAFDRGYIPLGISPAESNLRISIDNVTGRVRALGNSVVIVTPEAPAAGYVPAEVSEVKLVSGSTTGKIGYTIVDPSQIRNNHSYRVTFEDTVLAGRNNAPDTFRTKNYTLADITGGTPDTLIDRSVALADTMEQPLIDGFRLILLNEKQFGVNANLSGWSRSGIWDFNFSQWKGGGFVVGVQKPSDYRVVFGPLGSDTSTSFVVRSNSAPLPSKPVNFKVYNSGEDKQIDFAFFEADNAEGPGIFTAGLQGRNRVSDIIIFLERDTRDSLVITWSFGALFDSTRGRPADGDTATIVLSKLFRRDDVFEFTTSAHSVDVSRATSQLENIKVVPNPYIAAAEWEERNPFASGRGPRSLHFTHLPQNCTIRIYTVSGELVKTIEHSSGLLDGTEEWDMLTRDNLSASYGVYIYHIDAPGVGEKVGKFAIIK